jgi:hypothetical protein
MILKESKWNLKESSNWIVLANEYAIIGLVNDLHMNNSDNHA